jgi:hypothetical protein
MVGSERRYLSEATYKAVDAVGGRRSCVRPELRSVALAIFSERPEPRANGTMYPGRRNRRTASALSRASGDRTPTRQGKRRSSRYTVALLPMTLLVTSVALVGCGSMTVHDTSARKSTVSARKLEKHSLESGTARELAYFRYASGPTLARIGLSGGKAVGVVAIGCRAGKANSCYELAEFWEEPAR